MAKPPTWEELILDLTKNDNLQSRTCQIYDRQARLRTNDPHKVCPCGRLVRLHSFDGTSLQSKANNDRNYAWTHPKSFRSAVSTVAPLTVFGRLKTSDCKFIRLDNQTDMGRVYNLLVGDCGGQKPALILSVYGGAKYFTMTEKLEKEIIRGIIDAATTAGAWILTTGVNNGVSKLVGEGVAHYCLLKEDRDKVICIGLTMWRTINESMRFELKQATKNYPRDLLYRQVPDDALEDKETIEKNHTHCILFDNGELVGYLGDEQRSDFVKTACEDKDHTCYAVTIIVEGGKNTMDVIQHDIAARRPIVLIQGSGRLADVLCSLIERTSHSKQAEQSIPTDEDVKKALLEFFPNPDDLDIPEMTQQIQMILDKEVRYLLNVFSLDRDENVEKIIFKAIFIMKNKKVEIDNAKKKEREELNQDPQYRIDEDILLDLALQWNYIDGVLPILKKRQDAMSKNHEVIQDNMELYRKLFRNSLIKNRPAFLEHFLAAGFDPGTLIEIQHVDQRSKCLSDLYTKTYNDMNKSHRKYVKLLFGKPSIKTVAILDKKLNKFVGSFIGTIYSSEEDSYTQRVSIDLENHVCTCCSFGNKKSKKDKPLTNQNIQSTYSKDELLRDLFLWSVFMDMHEMAKTLLIHQQSRICAALIASAIFKRYSKSSTIVDQKERFQNQALDFETYAAEFINSCYKYNETLACELLLREIPIFGNVTCMQVAISSESKKLVGTPCFDQTLSQVWYNKLSAGNRQSHARPLQLFSILTFGFLAPYTIPYREKETDREDTPLSSIGINYYMDKKSPKGINDDTVKKTPNGINGDTVKKTPKVINDDTDKKTPKGVNDDTDKKTSKCISWTEYCSRFLYFHQSPMIKMSYHFISYIWFLLVFSYMMLYHLDSPDTFTIPHWTEIYVIITVASMFCEEARKMYREYKLRMIEQWGSTVSTVLTVLTSTFFITPYFLFFLGLAFRYRGYNESILTTARIIWAYDLELWYLGSLRFVMAFRFIGPKLFMLKNMLRDLGAFIYMIFIAIAAYGVVSRALILYSEIPFTANDLFRQILYEPYWFMYGDVSDKDLLDGIIDNGTAPGVAEATATHVLLAFHMLFINILILNLLIAVFTHTIDKVQENTEFYWRYQRYSFIRDYFENPPLAYPPLIIFTHIALIIIAIRREFRRILGSNQIADENNIPESKTVLHIFKMIPLNKEKQKQNAHWNAFENAATHSYARSIVEKNKKKDASIPDDIHSKSTINTIESDVVKPIADQKQMILSLKKEISAMTLAVDNNQKNIEEINKQMKDHVKQMSESLKWITNAMVRVKMNSSEEPPPTFESPSTDGDAPASTQPTISSDH